MIVGDNAPGYAQLIQRGDDLVIRRVPEDLLLALVDEDVHLQGFVADERRDAMMVREIRQVHARFAARCRPRVGLLVSHVP